MIDMKKIITIVAIFILYVFAYNTDIFGIRGTAVSKNSTGKGKEPVPILNPESLAKPIYEYPGVKRDVFSPVAKPAVKRPKRPKVVAKPKAIVPEPPKPVDVFKSSLTFMGFKEQETERTVYLSDSDDEVFIIRKGDTMIDKFEVIELTDEILTLIDRETGERSSIDLRGGDAEDIEGTSDQ